MTYILVVDYPNFLKFIIAEHFLEMARLFKIYLLDNIGDADKEALKEYGIETIDVSDMKDPPFNIINISEAIKEIKKKHPKDTIVFLSDSFYRINEIMKLNVKCYHALKLNEIYRKGSVEIY